jgi:hypothetical protein
LASLSFALNFLASGLDPVAMKITNVLIHLANGTLIFALVSSLLTSVHGEPRTNHIWTALLVAGGWMVLPINLTAVLYIVQRMESIANLFVLAGLLGYIAGRRRMLAGRPGLALAVVSVLIATGIGVLAKETAAMLPLYCALLEVFFFKMQCAASDGAKHRTDKRLVAFYVATLLLPFILGTAWLTPIVMNPEAWARRDFTLQTRLLSEARIVVDYIGWTITPTPTALSFYHDDFVQSTGMFAPWSTFASVLAIVGLAVLAWLLRQRAPLVGLGIAWFLACHTLTATVLPLELIYEHRNYFSSVGLVMAVIGVLRGETGRPGARSAVPYAVARHTLLGGLLIVWSAHLWITATAWNSPLSLAQELAQRGPDSPRAQYELGRTYIILSGYDPASPFTELAYQPLERAMKIQGSSVLAEQALIFLNGRMKRPVKDIWWESMREKLAARPPAIQDESALEALSKCQQSTLCTFSPEPLLGAFLAAVSHPHPSARLLAMYADFAWTNLKDTKLALSLQRGAVEGAPREMAYRLTLARMALATGYPEDARIQLGAIKENNLGGRYADDIGRLEEQLHDAENAPKR